MNTSTTLLRSALLGLMTACGAEKHAAAESW
jgi:hypothetical protein